MSGADERDTPAEGPDEGVPDGVETEDLPLGVPPDEDGDDDTELPGFPQGDPTHG